MDQLKEILQKAITERGITQSEVAQLAGIERKTLNSYVTGRTEPDLVTLKKIIKALSIQKEISQFLLEQNVPNSNKEAPGIIMSSQYLAGQLSIKDEVIAEKELRRKDAESIAQKMESHYQDMKAALERAQTTINEVLKPIKEQTAEILTSSKKVQDGLQSLKTEVAAENGEIMATLDQIAGNEAGTTAARAGTVEIGHHIEKSQKGKKAGIDKRG